MPIQVIERGEHPNAKPMHGTCGTCKTVVQCLKGDAKDFEDQREPGKYVNCPTCHNYIWLHDGPAPR